MKLLSMLSFLALGGVFAAGSLWLPPTLAGEIRPTTAVDRQWLSIPQVHAKLEAAGYRNIEKIERERGAYEVRATDRHGERVKLQVNPLSGEIYQLRRHEQYAGSDGNGARRDSTECTKRRCRDDLPSTPTPAPAPAR